MLTKLNAVRNRPPESSQRQELVTGLCYIFDSLRRASPELVWSEGRASRHLHLLSRSVERHISKDRNLNPYRSNVELYLPGPSAMPSLTL